MKQRDKPTPATLSEAPGATPPSVTPLSEEPIAEELPSEELPSPGEVAAHASSLPPTDSHSAKAEEESADSGRSPLPVPASAPAPVSFPEVKDELAGALLSLFREARSNTKTPVCDKEGKPVGYKYDSSAAGVALKAAAQVLDLLEPEEKENDGKLTVVFASDVEDWAN